MRSAHYERLQPAWAEGEAMLRVAERVGRFAIRGGETLPDSPEGGFPRRHRDAMNAHSGYFRATLFGGPTRVAGVEPFAENAAFADAAHRLYGRPLVRPVGVSAGILDDREREIAGYAWIDLRFAVSWRAHCYCDDAEERKVREHKRGLTRERALEVLTDDLRAGGAHRRERSR